MIQPRVIALCVVVIVNERPSIWIHYARQREALLRFLTRHTRNPDVAQDLLQETWLRIANGAGVVVDDPRAYLFRIASNLAVDHFRTENRRLRTDEVDALLTIPDDVPDPEAVAIGRSELAVVATALEEMPERRRAILMMSRVQGLKYRAIADHFGISTRTVEFEIVRALDFCGTKLKKIPTSDSD